MGQELGGGQILLGALSPLGQNGRARQRHAVTSAPACRHLVLVLGDQLSGNSTAFDDFDAEQDVVLMVEAREESTHVWSHRARTALFLAAMRHFAQRLETEGKRVVYRRLDESRDATLADGWYAAVTAFCPQRIVCVEPGDWRVWQQIKAVVAAAVALGDDHVAGEHVHVLQHHVVAVRDQLARIVERR